MFQKNTGFLEKITFLKKHSAEFEIFHFD